MTQESLSRKTVFLHVVERSFSTNELHKKTTRKERARGSADSHVGLVDDRRRREQAHHRRVVRAADRVVADRERSGLAFRYSRERVLQNDSLASSYPQDSEI